MTQTPDAMPEDQAASVSVDLSVVVTAHDETLVCGPAMQAADLAIAQVEAAGHSVERRVVLDCATPATRAWFGQEALAHWPKLDSPQGDLGRSRNWVVPQLGGRFVAFLDADDLFSENWLLEALRALIAAEAQGQRAIAHPELNWLFDGADSVYWKPAQDDPLFLPQYFHLTNYYDSLCMAPRAAHLDIPYVSRDIPRGLSFQDWQFAIETMAAGWQHLSVADTIIFKRRRDSSLVSESRARQSILRPLAAMQIDRVAGLAGPRSPAPAPARGAQPPCPEPQPPEAGQVSQIGAAFAARRARAATRHRRLTGRGAERDEIAACFDLTYYLARHGDLNRAEQMDLRAHFLRAGSAEGRPPSALFSTRAYLERCPEAADHAGSPFHHWITKGWAKGAVALPYPGVESIARALGRTPAELEALFAHRYCDLRARLEYGTLGAQAVAAARLEPLIERGWRAALDLHLPPLHSPMVAGRLAALLDLQADCGGPARFVICVNRARWGGGLRVEGLLAQALADLHGPEAVLVLTTDAPGPLPEGKLPKGVRHVDAAARLAPLKPAQRMRVLVELLRTLAPEVVINVNARLVWDMLGPYGQALAHGTRLVAWLLCNERNDYGHWTGYPLTRFYRHFDQLAAVCTDSHALATELCQRHMLPPEQAGRVRVMSAPVDPGIPLAAPPRWRPFRRPQIHWAGRFDPQKRVDLVYRLAKALPECDIRMWGEFVMGRAEALPDKPRNVTHEGKAARFADLPLHKADLFLYTSGWDGVPQILLEVAMTGVPIVGAAVGGTPEVLRPPLAAALDPEAPLDAWVAAIRAVLADPEAARARAADLRAHLIADRGPGSYRQVVADLLEAVRATPPDGGWARDWEASETSGAASDDAPPPDAKTAPPARAEAVSSS